MLITYFYIYIYLVDKVPQDITSTVLNIYVHMHKLDTFYWVTVVFLIRELDDETTPSMTAASRKGSFPLPAKISVPISVWYANGSKNVFRINMK